MVYVHFMNKNDEKVLDTYRSFQLMAEIDRGGPLSQRELAKRLGIALGLVNSYLKNLIAKGYIRVKAFPRNRYAYLLTPRGLTEKTRLAYQHLSYFNNLYKVAREEFVELFHHLKEQDITAVAFCGVDESAEIAYLSLKEAGLELTIVMDDLLEGKEFFGSTVTTIAKGLLSGRHRIVITSLRRGEELRQRLVELGVPADTIYSPGRQRH
jgi:DNA-binding MarR family transcriptional regulator